MTKPEREVTEALRALLKALRTYGLKIDQARPELRKRLRELDAMRSTSDGS